MPPLARQLPTGVTRLTCLVRLNEACATGPRARPSVPRFRSESGGVCERHDRSPATERCARAPGLRPALAGAGARLLWPLPWPNVRVFLCSADDAAASPTRKG